MTGTVIVLAIGIGFLILIERNLRLKNAVRIKQRIAANLHDELGANLHAIGMLGRLLKRSNTTAKGQSTEFLPPCKAVAHSTPKSSRPSSKRWEVTPTQTHLILH